MKTSVIMPAYNAQKYIGTSIESVLAQTLADWELLIVDDASTDQTAKTVRSFQDKRIKYHYSATSLGSGPARNLAFTASENRYKALLDSDDLWHPQKLEKQLEFMKRSRCSLSCTDYVKIDHSGEVCSQTIKGPSIIKYTTLLGSNSIACSTALIDSEIHSHIQMPDIRLNHDYALWLSLLRDGTEARRLPEVLTQYRIHSENLSRDRFSSARHNWRIYRDLEKLSRMKSSLCMARYIAAGIRKFTK